MKLITTRIYNKKVRKRKRSVSYIFLVNLDYNYRKKEEMNIKKK